MFLAPVSVPESISNTNQPIGVAAAMQRAFKEEAAEKSAYLDPARNTAIDLFLPKGYER
jgi:hypothetical protein